MRKVVNSDMVFHLWAHQTQGDARNGGDSVSFLEKYLYSYATVIGYHCGDFVLLSRDTFSRTTQRHISKAARACRHLKVIYSGTFSRWNTFYFNQQRVVDELLAHYEENIEALTRKRTPSTRGAVVYTLRRTQEDLEYLKNDWGMNFEVPALPDNMEEILEAAKKYAAEKEERALIRAEQKRADDALRYAAWLNGGLVSFPSSYHDYQAAQLTIRGDTVYTSQGAQVPLSHVLKALEFYHQRKWPYQTNGHRIPLGHFVLDSIDVEGNVRAGCHRFTAQEIERFTTQWALVPENYEHQVAA